MTMLLKFLGDRRGNFAMMTSVIAVPLLGALGLAVDYTEMSRQKQQTLSALDAAGIATARRLAQGADDAVATQFAKDFFLANLGNVDPKMATLTVLLPKNNTGGGTLKLTADLEYQTYFFGAFQKLTKGYTDNNVSRTDFTAESEVRLKNTLEVALVLDNSGSMDYIGTGSGQKRIDLLKTAAKELVTTLSKDAAQMKQISKPVQFGLVPFAASVNVGPSNATASWMDTDGISPIHHENFDWSQMGAVNALRKVEKSGGIFYKKGAGWGTEQNEKVTRFTLYKDMKIQTGTERLKTGTTTQRKCGWEGWNYVCRDVTVDVFADVPILATYAPWQGCVEMRPYPYNTDDTAPSSATPATLYVPMFAPDETDEYDNSSRPANNSWISDKPNNNAAAVDDQRYTPKYYEPTWLKSAASGTGAGPNMSCTTKAITPLTDVSGPTGKDAITAAIDAMTPLGGTNVPQGLAWGWKVVSSGAPFIEGRPESERGNDKVVILLTDGENTYYTPDSVTAQSYTGNNANYGANDRAGNKSIYSAYGYAGTKYENGDTRIFKGTSTSVPKTTYTNANFTKGMNEHMAALCSNAKAKGVMVMTVALDLDDKNDAQKTQIAALKACASDSRFARNSDGTPKKLFWNATGKSLAEDFKKIGEELSNLRIVG